MRNEHAKIGDKERKELEQIIHEMASDKKQLTAFLEDLLTPAEIHELVARLQIIKKLAAGKSQRQVAKELKVSVATVTRGARTLANPHGGFNILLHKNQWRRSP